MRSAFGKKQFSFPSVANRSAVVDQHGEDLQKEVQKVALQSV